MDPLSAFASALTLASFLLESLKLGRKCVEVIRGQSAEAANLSLRMSLALDRGESLHNLLFGAGEGASQSEVTPIFRHLRPKTSANVVFIVNKYHDLIHSRYRDLHQTYLLEADMTFHSASSSQKGGSGGIQQHISWLFKGRRLLQSTTEDCERLNELLMEVIQLYLLERSPTFSNLSVHPNLAGLKSDKDVMQLGLDDEINILRITSSENQAWESLEVTNVQFDDAASHHRKSGFCNGHKVLVEFKGFILEEDCNQNRATPQPSKPTMQRIRQLATILHQNHSARSRLLRCEGLYRHLSSPAYGLILQYPDGRTTPPRSLLDILLTPRSRTHGIKPPLEIRMNLALTLAVALFQFHAVKWVHKSVRSDNIIFFPRDHDSSLLDIISEPWLIGFEYAREDFGFSDNPIGSPFDPSKDLYRHPDTWGLPTVRFAKKYDIYSLGVVLLEVGLWQSIRQLEQNGFKHAVYDDRFDIRRLFIQKAKETLPFFTGTCYADLTARCLAGSFDDGAETGAVDTAEQFRDQVSLFNVPRFIFIRSR